MPAIPPVASPPPARRRRVGIAVALLISAATVWAGYSFLYPDWRADRELEAARKAAAESDYGQAREHLRVLRRPRATSM